MRLRDKTLLRHAMLFQHMKPADVAAEAHVAESLVRHLLRDPSQRTARWTCSAPTAAAIERALNVDPGTLFEREKLSVVRNTQQSERLVRR
jgi:hypothetical protein